MNDKVIAYEPFFFRVIDTTDRKSEEFDRILNLDNYHHISRNGSYVSAATYSGGDLKHTPVAQCNNEDGARWVMDCIMRRQTTTEEQVISVEQNGYDDTPAII